MTWRTKCLLGLAALIPAGLGASAMYVFQNGQMADAAQVNGNFETLRASVEELQAHTPRVVSVTKTDPFSSTAVLAAIPGLSASLTPRSTASQVLVTATINYDSTRGNSAGGFRIRRNGVDIDASLPSAAASGSRYRVMADFGSNNDADQSGMHRTIQFLDTPASAAEVTYSIWLVQESTSFTTTINRARVDANQADDPRMSSTLTLIEFP